MQALSHRALRRAVAVAVGVLMSLSGFGSEWTQYRGPTHDGISTDRITTLWEGAVTNAVWKAPTKNGFSSFAVCGGRAFTQVKRSVGSTQKEVCVALSIANGVELWSTAIDEAVYDVGSGSDDGPRTTPSVDPDAVYVLSSHLKLFRLNPNNGAVVWNTNLLTGYGGTLVPWQNAASPLLESGRIFVNVNCGGGSLIAIRTADGGLDWRAQGSEAMTHSTPVLATVQGVRQVIFATQSGLVALESSTGRRLWSFAYPFQYSMWLAVSPVVYGDIVFISGANGMGSCAAQISSTDGNWSARQLWHTDLASTWMTPVCRKGYLYGHFGSTTFSFKCLSIETGMEMWSVDGFGRSGTLLVDDRVIALTEGGTLVLIQPVPQSYVEVGRFSAVTGKCWNSPAVSDGRVYVRSTLQAACYNLSVPELRLEARFIDARAVELLVTNGDGTPLTPERLSGIAILATTNLELPSADWSKLSLVLTNGSARVDTTTAACWFFRAAETPSAP